MDHLSADAARLRRLRPRTWVDTVEGAAKSMAWAIVALVAIGAFFLLVFGALRSREAFARLVLGMALTMIAALSFLVFLNIIQRVLSDRGERLEKRLQDEVEAAILSALESGDEARRQALLLPYLDRVDIVEAVARALDGPAQEAVRTLMREMRANQRPEAEARQSRQKWRQVSALLALGWMASPDSLDLLQEAVYDPDTDIGYAACHALAQYDSALAYERLLEALREGRLARSRVATLIESARFGRATELLIECTRDPEPGVRFWIAYLLGKRSDPKALPALARLAGDGASSVRANSARSFGEIGGAESIAYIRRFLRDEDWLVRARAAKAAGAIGTPELIDDILPLLGDPQWWPRQNTVLALERIGRAAVPQLEAQLSASDRFARNKAAEVLGRLGIINERIAELSGPPAVAEAARAFLIKVGRAEAVNIIEAAAQEADPAMQTTLAEILEAIGPAERAA